MNPSLPLFTLSSDYSRIKVVKSFEELIHTPFQNGINAICWQRTLTGDFDEIVRQLVLQDDITTLDDDLLQSLPLSPAGKEAVATLLQDQQLLRDAGLAPILDCIRAYPRDEEAEAVPVHVYSFHADSATVEADTYLCSYNESCSEGLRNEEAQRRVDLPDVRARLLEDFGGQDDEAFREYLNDNCYDLHYAPLPNAQPFRFGIGNLWRIAVEYPGSPVPPCIHRAPENLPGRPPRLLLIS